MLIVSTASCSDKLQRSARNVNDGSRHGDNS